MPNKKKTNQKTKKTKKVKSQVVGPPKLPAAMVAVAKMGRQLPKFRGPSTAMVEMVCSLSDPFCQHAKGSKWPDGFGEATMTAQLRGHQTMITNSSGNDIRYISPTIQYGIMTAASYTNPNFTLTANYSATAGYNIVSPYINTYRVVSAGIIVRNICPALTAGGYIILTRQASMPAPSILVASGSVQGVDSATHSICAGMEVPIIFRELGTSSRTFVAPGVTSTTYTPNGWDVVSIEIAGAPASTNMLDIEYVYNIEFTLLPANVGLQQFLPVSGPSNSMAANVANKVSSTLSSLAYHGVEHFGKVAVSAIVAKLAGPKAGSMTYQALGNGDIPEVD